MLNLAARLSPVRAALAARPYTYAASGIAAVIIIFSFVHVFVVAPTTFPLGTVVVVPEGASVIGTANLLVDAGAIRSPFLFRVIVGNRHVQAGSYVFDTPKGLVALAMSLVRGTDGTKPVRVTFPEGVTVRDMADILYAELASFNRAAFLANATPQEGYLFPDTYFFSPFVSAEDVISTLRSTFDARMNDLAPAIDVSGHTRADIVIMASLLEKEAKTFAEKQVIAGILWKRIAIGMPLQVDAVFGYIKGTDTYHPSHADLDIDSPYNTYRNRGLPPTPIANPGSESLRAAASPVKTDYLYYLTGRDGVMRYAKTFEEHKANRAKYLD